MRWLLFVRNQQRKLLLQHQQQCIFRKISTAVSRRRICDKATTRTIATATMTVTNTKRTCDVTHSRQLVQVQHQHQQLRPPQSSSSKEVIRHVTPISSTIRESHWTTTTASAAAVINHIRDNVINSDNSTWKALSIVASFASCILYQNSKSRKHESRSSQMNEMEDNEEVEAGRRRQHVVSSLLNGLMTDLKMTHCEEQQKQRQRTDLVVDKDGYIPNPLNGNIKQKPYEVSIRAMKGGRFTMEDEFFVSGDGTFVGVFDGHGGAGVSQHLKARLYDQVVTQLKRTRGSMKRDQDGNVVQYGTPSVSQLSRAMKAGLNAVNREILDNDELEYQGSTAIVCAIHQSPDSGRRTVITANVGDSRAVLSRNGQAIALSNDHKLSDKKERERILACGETMEWDAECNLWRVHNLSVSRAIGDRFAKPAVSGMADITKHAVSEGEDEFILLASDGLWDVFQNQDAVSFVHTKLAEVREAAASGTSGWKKDDSKPELIRRNTLVIRKAMARLLAREAYMRGSGDNISVVIVWLKDV